MKRNVASMSNTDVGKALNAVVKGIGRNDLGEILFNWNELQLNEEGDKIIGYPGRDGVYSKGKEGGKVNISKREFLEWLPVIAHLMRRCTEQISGMMPTGRG